MKDSHIIVYHLYKWNRGSVLIKYLNKYAISRKVMKEKLSVIVWPNKNCGSQPKSIPLFEVFFTILTDFDHKTTTNWYQLNMPYDLKLFEGLLNYPIGVLRRTRHVKQSIDYRYRFSLFGMALTLSMRLLNFDNHAYGRICTKCHRIYFTEFLD